MQGGRGGCGQSWRRHILWHQEGPWRRQGWYPRQQVATVTKGRPPLLPGGERAWVPGDTKD